MNDVNKKAYGYNTGGCKKSIVLRIVFSYEYEWNRKNHAYDDTDKTKAVNKMEATMQLN